MATQFLTSNQLNHEIEQLFETAGTQLILISPYISLHERYASVLKAKIQNDKLAITIVFGKNEKDPSRSMKRADIEFFMQFPNVEVKYEPRLHAKYYANEETAIITSMNLYRYSQDHNIEAGIKLEAVSLEGGLANRIIGRTDVETVAWEFFERVIKQATPIYKKEPRYESALLGITKRYVKSEVVEDRVAEYFTDERSFSKGAVPQQPSKQTERPVEALAPTPTPAISATPKPISGYCIRTGAAIPFNVKKPFTEAAFTSWSRYKEENYKEKFCHFSGEPSNGETSFAKPIMWKNWSKAKATFDL
ncbi:MAG: phospholipase D family protein [Flavobacteriales bacterium]|nr:phospholipase D family protein [Flavobacteriales bacterium]